MSGEQLGDLLLNLLDLTVEHLDHPDQSERDSATSRTLGAGQAWSRLSHSWPTVPGCGMRSPAPLEDSSAPPPIRAGTVDMAHQAPTVATSTRSTIHPRLAYSAKPCLR